MSELNGISNDMVRFAITGKDESVPSIVVTYWIDGYGMKVAQNLLLPIDGQTNAIPRGTALAEHILQHAPFEQLVSDIARFKAAVLVDFSEIDQLIEQGKSTIPVD